MPSVPNGELERRVRALELQQAVIVAQQSSQSERLEEVRDELRYVKRSLLALVFTILGGIGVLAAQGVINGGFGA